MVVLISRYLYSLLLWVCSHRHVIRFKALKSAWVLYDKRQITLKNTFQSITCISFFMHSSASHHGFAHTALRPLFLFLEVELSAAAVKKRAAKADTRKDGGSDGQPAYSNVLAFLPMPAPPGRLRHLAGGRCIAIPERRRGVFIYFICPRPCHSGGSEALHRPRKNCPLPAIPIY